MSKLEKTECIELLSWSDAKEALKAANPDLYKIISKISPSNRYKLIRARFSYGDEIIKNGHLNLPTEMAKPEFLKKLEYSQIPLGFILNNSCEVYIEINHRVIPLNYLKKGEFFGVFETLDLGSPSYSTPIWTVSAGARSLLMLPKTSDANQYRHLVNAYDAPKLMPNDPTDHWGVFKKIAENDATCDWHCDILFFTADWFKHQDDYEWAAFNNYLLRAGWNQSKDLRYEHSYCYIWQILANSIDELGIKPSYYQVDTVKHLIAIKLGAFPGFVPSNGSEEAGPTSAIENAYIHVYQLRDYLPVLLHPELNRRNPLQSLYYSLTSPSLPGGGIAQSARGKLKELEQIKIILDKFLENINLSSVPLPARLKPSLFRYFHTEPHPEINSADILPVLDPSFVRLKQKFKDRIFPGKNLFARGCIQIGNHTVGE